MLDARLKAIADFVRKDSFMCDVGTDHAYLPCYLLQKGITTHCVACDINELPLNQARAHIAQFGFSKQIEIILSDGLQNVPSNKAEDIVIAGMGGELILKILLAVDYTKDKNKRFILQPMTNVPLLRRSLYENGFEIIEEKPVIDKKHCYTIMLVQYCGVSKQQDEVFLHLGKIPEQESNEARHYIMRQYEKMVKISTGLKNSNENKDESHFYEDLATKIKRYCKE